MNWDDIADAYLSISEDRDRILSPALLRILEETRAMTIVDVGGGDGRFIELLWNQVADKMRIRALALTDPSSRMRTRARARLSDIPNLQVTQSLADLPQGSWDLALLIAVWMGLETDMECVGLLREVKTLLTARGRMVAAVTHPCFRDRAFHSYSTSFDMGNYLRSATRFRVTLYDSARSLSFTDTHWTIADHVRQLAAAGLAVEAMIELPEVEVGSDGVPWLLIVARHA